MGTGEDRCRNRSTHQDAAGGGVDPPEDVADHVERRDQAELQSVVDHHGDEQDVARVLVKQTVKGTDLGEKVKGQQ